MLREYINIPAPTKIEHFDLSPSPTKLCYHVNIGLNPEKALNAFLNKHQYGHRKFALSAPGSDLHTGVRTRSILLLTIVVATKREGPLL